MPLSLSLNRSAPQMPKSISLSTPLYLLTTICAVTAIILLAFSGDGFISNGHDDYGEDLFLIFPINTLLVSALTAPVRCFFWVLSFWFRVRWVRRGEEGEGEGEGSIRLADDDGDEWRCKKGWGKVLLSWNAWLGATLAASLGVLIWRYVEGARGRMLRDEAGCAAVLLAADCVLHAWLAVPGLGDAEFMALRNPLEGEDTLVHGGEERLDEGEKYTEKVEEKESAEK